MGTLDKHELITMMKEDKLSFEPMIDAWQLQPNGIDLRIGWDFYIPKTWDINEKGRVATSVDYMDYSKQPEGFQMIKLKPGQYFEILPKEYILISSLEKIELKSDTLMAILYSRTSMMRRGLSIGDGVVDIRYSGQLIIPMMNNTNDQVIRIYPGERAAQLIFHTTGQGLSDEEAVIHGLNKAKYQGSNAYSIDSRVDKKDEIELIVTGELNKLKDNYQIEGV